MVKVVILGAGVMGCALTIPLARNGVHATVVGTPYDRQTVETLAVTGNHPALPTALPPTNKYLQVEQMAQAFEGADVALIGGASVGAPWAAEQLARHLGPGCAVISVTKGIHADSAGNLRPLYHAFTEKLPEGVRETTVFSAICGPSIASEVAQQVDTAVTFAGEAKHEGELHKLAGLFRTDFYHVSVTTDLLGAEICAATKNIFAIGVGFGQGLGAREANPVALPSADLRSVNPGAALFTQAHLEMKALVDMAGGDPATVDGLGGVGDLFVTCTGGRNVRAGRFIGGGATYQEVHEHYMAGETIEGIEAIRVVGGAIETRTSLGRLEPDRFPLIRFLYAVVAKGVQPEVPWRALFHG